MMDDRSEWTGLDYEIHADWLATLTPWQVVAYLAQIDKRAAREYASSATGCESIETDDGARLPVAAPPRFTADGAHVLARVPATGAMRWVFVPTPRMEG
jgi:hypothetical protein